MLPIKNPAGRGDENPIEYRKRKLAKLVRGPRLGIVLNEYYKGDGEIVFNRACKPFTSRF